MLIKNSVSNVELFPIYCFTEISKVDMSSAAEVGTMETQKGGNSYYGSSSRHGPVFLKAVELVSLTIFLVFFKHI